MIRKPAIKRVRIIDSRDGNVPEGASFKKDHEIADASRDCKRTSTVTLDGEGLVRALVGTDRREDHPQGTQQRSVRGTALAGSSYPSGVKVSSTAANSSRQIPVTAEPEVNRAHIRDLITGGVDEDIMELFGNDAADYDWDSHDIFMLLDESPSSDEHAKTSFIPPNIFGTEPDKAMITAVCEKWKHVFNTKLNDEPARIPPMQLNVNDEAWFTNKTRGPPRPTSLSKQEAIRDQIDIYIPQKVVKASQATNYSQAHLVPKQPSVLVYTSI